MRFGGFLLSIVGAAALWSGPAAAQRSTEDLIAQYTVAIDLCNSVGYGSASCRQNRDTVVEYCSRGHSSWCDLANRIDETGSRQSPFPRGGQATAPDQLPDQPVGGAYSGGQAPALGSASQVPTVTIGGPADGDGDVDESKRTAATVGEGGTGSFDSLLDRLAGD